MVMPSSPGEHGDCHCVVGVLSLVGDKWTVLIVMVLRERARRFNEVKRAVGGISQQMLTRTLKALERDGLVSRTVHPTVPPQVEYALTELGHSLAKPVYELGDWARAHLDEIERHRARYDGPSRLRTEIADTSSRSLRDLAHQ